jgi:hypothetical protein
MALLIIDPIMFENIMGSIAKQRTQHIAKKQYV